MRLDDTDLDGSMEPNPTINIHWAGKGLKADIKTWSEGCQVINGSMYINAEGKLVDCSSFAGARQTELNENPAKTRGAYNVLLDLVTALGSDLGGNKVKYTLLRQQDLDLAPTLRDDLARVARNVIEKLK